MFYRIYNANVRTANTGFLGRKNFDINKLPKGYNILYCQEFEKQAIVNHGYLGLHVCYVE